MTVSAPPDHPGPTVTADGDRFDALIEEARKRARRRRHTCGAVAVGIAAVIIATVAIDRSGASHRDRSRLDGPAAAVNAAPMGELVASMLTRELLAHRNVWLYLYSDGRLITASAGNDGWLERRLTPEAVTRVQDEINASGLFDPDPPPPGSHGSAGANIQARIGDRQVNVIRVEDQAWTPEFDRLAGRLTTLESWLPPTAWAQPNATAYLPARYAVCAPTTLSADLSAQLPPSAAAALETASIPPWDQILPRIDPAAHQRHRDNGVCVELVREQAQRLAASLDRRVDLATSRRGLFLRIDAPAAGTNGLRFISILPHGAPECACYG